ncbi:MAG: type II secretion system F family protein [Pseudomonadales bacterium]|nr:type II secretion system F family protein [Pseudomonadales bacterium]
MLYGALVIIGLLVLWAALKQGKKHSPYLEQASPTFYEHSWGYQQQALDLQSLNNRTLGQAARQHINKLQKNLGKLAALKVLVFTLALVFIGLKLNQSVFQTSAAIIVGCVVIGGYIFAYQWFKKRQKAMFDRAFPDALNLMSSAISAGESITQAIAYVGKQLDNEVGREFKLMSVRLQLGEPEDTVFRKSCHRFPYSSFQFFIITLRANMRRGGQLKEVMSRLNRLMFNAHAMEKKKFVMTSEARMSAKIVAAIPFLFLFVLQFLSPENYAFVMHNPDGRPILYYMLVSEGIGIGIIWLLMKGVK